MKTQHNYVLATLACVSALLSPLVRSAPIANWKELNPNAAVPANSGMDTDSPTIGDGTANNADDAWVAGRFGTVGSPASVTLAVGETLTVSGTMVLTGGEGVASQLRFGVFDDGGQFAANGTTWSGGWLYVPTDKLYQARTNGAYISISSNAVGLGTTQTNSGTWSANSTTAYDWSISVTRDSETTVDLSASVTGGDNAISYTASVDDVKTSVFTYTAVGMLFGGNMNLDQAALSNVEYSGGSTPVVDTDGDGLNDEYEQMIIDADPEDDVTSLADVMGTGATPAVTDFDSDGSNDAEEAANGTNPLDPDSDDDSLLDGVETDTGVYVSASDTGTDPLDPDTDDDGLLDGVETNTNTYAGPGDTGTNPLDQDTDGDGLGDGFEVTNGTDPTDDNDPPPPPGGGPIQIAPDGAWTWFNDERAIWHQGRLYCGYVMKNGKVGISRFDPATMATAHTSLSGFTQIDDHNNPSITVLPDNRLMVVYSQHGGSSYRRISTVTEPSSIGDWGGEINTGGGISYANTYRLSAESDRIYHFNRAINFNPTLIISDDDGATFGSQIHFIATGTGGTRPYPKYTSNGVDRIDLIYTDGHPRNENNSIYHLFYQDGNFVKTDGTLVEAIADLPIEHDLGKRGTEVYTYSASAWGPGQGPDDWIPNGRGWTWDICYGSDGHPVCVFQVQVDNVTGSGWNHDRIYYYYARWTGTEWQRRFIAHGGRGLYSSEDDYGGGMAIDPDHPNVIYISTNAEAPFDLTDINDVPLGVNERYEIWQGTTTDGGLTFTWQPVTQGSPSDNLRPIVPENHGYDRSLLWFRGTYTTYSNYDTEVVGIFQNQLRLLDSQVGPAGGDLTWASSPGASYRIMASGDLQGFPHEVATGIGSQGSMTQQSFSLPPALSGAGSAFFRVEEE